jgi:hypothetical protein
VGMPALFVDVRLADPSAAFTAATFSMPYTAFGLRDEHGFLGSNLVVRAGDLDGGLTFEVLGIFFTSPIDFFVRATEGDVIRFVDITFQDVNPASVVRLASLQQVRIEGVQAVPEPSTLVLCLIGALMLGCLVHVSGRGNTGSDTKRGPTSSRLPP